MTNYDRTALDMGFLFVRFLSDRGEAWLQQLANTESFPGCFSLVYQVLIKHKLIEPTESLPENEKRDLWEEAKRLSKRKEQPHLIQVARAIHVLGTMCQLDKKQLAA